MTTDVNSKVKKLNHWATVGELMLIDEIKSFMNMNSNAEVIREVLLEYAITRGMNIPDGYKVESKHGEHIRVKKDD